MSLANSCKSLEVSPKESASVHMDARTLASARPRVILNFHFDGFGLILTWVWKSVLATIENRWTRQTGRKYQRSSVGVCA